MRLNIEETRKQYESYARAEKAGHEVFDFIGDLLFSGKDPEETWSSYYDEDDLWTAGNRCINARIARQICDLEIMRTEEDTETESRKGTRKPSNRRERRRSTRAAKSHKRDVEKIIKKHHEKSDRGSGTDCWIWTIPIPGTKNGVILKATYDRDVRPNNKQSRRNAKNDCRNYTNDPDETCNEPYYDDYACDECSDYMLCHPELQRNMPAYELVYSDEETEIGIVTLDEDENESPVGVREDLDNLYWDQCPEQSYTDDDGIEFKYHDYQVSDRAAMDWIKEHNLYDVLVAWAREKTER